jgi:hypothetical protein
MAMAAKMPMIATTIINSISVKPRWTRAIWCFIVQLSSSDNNRPHADARHTPSSVPGQKIQVSGEIPANSWDR